MQTFSTTIRKIDINPYVKIPDPILRRLLKNANKTAGPIPVAGKLQGKPFLATVVRFRGMWRLYLNLLMRREASVVVGDKVNVKIWFDKKPRKVSSPSMFTMALSKNKKAKEAFENLAPSRRKEILRYLNHLKQPETLERNINKAILFLQGKKVQGLVAVTRTKREVL